LSHRLQLKLTVLFALLAGISCGKKVVTPAVDEWQWEIVNGGFSAMAIWGTSATDIFAVGLNGTIGHYDGVSWKPMQSPTASDLYGIWGTAHNDVFAVGSMGTILHFDGASWRVMVAGMPVQLSSVSVAFTRFCGR
jgi:hypothetical protein